MEAEISPFMLAVHAKVAEMKAERLAKEKRVRALCREIVEGRDPLYTYGHSKEQHRPKHKAKSRARIKEIIQAKKGE